MVLGRIKLINTEKNMFCVMLEEDNYTIVEYYDDNDISENDLILAGNILGDVFIKNETSNKDFQAKVRYIGFTENKMKKIMDL